MNRCCFGLILAVAIPLPPIWAANVNDFIDFTLRAANNSVLLPGRLYVPPEASASPRPLILFLHGAGESGTNNLGQLSVNMDNLLAEAKQRGAFLYAPQTTINTGWTTPTVTSNIDTMLDRALAEQNVDMNRLYATGLSMGGGGVWNVISRYPERFAAAVPICGVAPASDFLPANLLDEPIWAFHARDDNVVSVTRTRTVVSNIVRAANEPVPPFPSRDPTSFFHFDSQTLDLHYTEPPTGGHAIWFPVYAHEPMYDWMFARSSVPEPSAIFLAVLAACGLAFRRLRAAR